MGIQVQVDHYQQAVPNQIAVDKVAALDASAEIKGNSKLVVTVKPSTD